MNSSFVAFHAGMACGFLIDSYGSVAWDPILGVALTVAAGVGVVFGVYKLVTDGREAK